VGSWRLGVTQSPSSDAKEICLFGPNESIEPTPSVDIASIFKGGKTIKPNEKIHRESKIINSKDF
jgi:hypothetical protein